MTPIQNDILIEVILSQDKVITSLKRECELLLELIKTLCIMEEPKLD